MFALTYWEVEQLKDEMSLRPKLWVGKDKWWIRRRHGENFFALKLENGLPHNMYSLDIKLLRSDVSKDEILRYVMWMLRKLTSYAERERVEKYLRDNLHTQSVEDLARNILGFTVCNATTCNDDELRVIEPIPVSHSVCISTEQETTATMKPKKKSLYLRRLLGEE